MSKLPFHIELLLSEFNKRKLNNSRYSMRAFARFLDFVPSTLCRILANRQELSISATKKIIKSLNLTEEDGMKFISSIAEEKKIRTLKLLYPTLLANSKKQSNES